MSDEPFDLVFSDIEGCGFVDPSVQIQPGSRRSEKTVFVGYDITL